MTVTTLPNHDSAGCAQAGGACAPNRHVGQPLDLDPVDVFAKLVREVDAGRALVTMTPAGDQRRAALDALTLARDVLDDARRLLVDPRCPRCAGPVEVVELVPTRGPVVRPCDHAVDRAWVDHVLAGLVIPELPPCTRANGTTCKLHNVEHWRER